MYDLPMLICAVLAFVPALMLHEVAHGFAAYKLGDPTAKRAGRLSLNPAKHIDPFGTVILPICLMAMGMPVFGYAKPVPYNPAYFENPRKGDMVVSLAGPLANLLQAMAGAAVAAVLWFALPIPQLAAYDLFYYAYFTFLPMFVMTNLCLLFFNIIPIPPLDGSSVLLFFLPTKYLPQYYKVQQYALPILLLVLVLVPAIFPSINLVGWYMDVTAGNLFNLLYSWM